jgi:hypothetical protein
VGKKLDALIKWSDKPKNAFKLSVCTAGATSGATAFFGMNAARHVAEGNYGVAAMNGGIALANACGAALNIRNACREHKRIKDESQADL